MDPFCGVGTTGVATLSTGNVFIGVEIQDDHFNIAMAEVAAALVRMKPQMMEMK